MKLLFLSSLLGLALATPSALAISDDETAARNTALSVAGAFSNDGFKLRDGFWAGPIAPKQKLLIQVNLYAGNAYWFTVGATDKAQRMDVTIFDESGAPVSAEPYQDGPRAAAGFEPKISGAYYIRLRELEGEPASAALVYSYK